MQELDRVRQNWERFGKESPLWAILNDPNRGKWSLEEFFETGRVDVHRQLHDVAAMGIEVRHGRALDFGCGVGRLTQALGDIFDECDGVDVAASMIELARRYNRLGARARYHVNPNANLSIFGDQQFDFVLSIIVLQHVPPEISRGYVREFMRILKPGGVAVFQAPSARRDSWPALSPDGFRAEITPERPPRSLKAGQRVQLVASVRNIGTETWQRGMAIKLGNRWWRRGALAVPDDGRAELPRQLPPGESADFQLTVTAPLRPGTHELELDLVQEGVAWFSERGSRSIRIQVSVASSVAMGKALVNRAPGVQQLMGLRAGRPPAVMDMHCLPREDVVAAVEAGGARIVEVSEMDVCGDAFESLRYVAVR